MAESAAWLLVIGKVKSDSFDQKKPVESRIRAFKNQSFSRIILFKVIHKRSSLEAYILNGRIHCLMRLRILGLSTF